MTKLKYHGIVFYFLIPEQMINAAIAHEKEIIQWVHFKFWKEEWTKARMIITACDKNDYYSFESQFSEN